MPYRISVPSLEILPGSLSRRLKWVGVLVVCWALLAGCENADFTPEAHLDRARQAFLQGDMATGEIEIKNALKQDPNNMDARFVLGQIQLELGDPEAALLEFQRAERLGFDAGTVAIPMGRAYLLSGRYDEVLNLPIEAQGRQQADSAYLRGLRGYARLSKRQVEQAENEFRQAVLLDPDLEFALLGQVRLAMARADLTGAKSTVQAALEIHPESAEGHVLLGEIETLLGDAAASEVAYSKAVGLDPKNIDALSSRALMRLALGKLDLAGEDVEALIELAPDNNKTNYASGLYHFQRDDYAKAKEALDKLVADDPNHSRAMYILGVAELRLGNAEQGLKYLERYASLRPSSIDGAKQLASAYLALNYEGRAQQTVDTALNYHPNNVGLLGLSALVSVIRGESDHALMALRRAEQIAPNASGLQLSLGLLMMQGGNAEDAVDAFNNEIAAGDRQRIAENARVLAYLRSGASDAALQAARKLAELHPKDPVRQNLLAYVYQKLGRTDDARLKYRENMRLLPGNPIAAQNLAVMARAKSNEAEVRELYEQVIENFPNHVPSLVNLGLIGVQSGQPAQGERHLNKALELEPSNLEARLALVQYYSVVDAGDKARALLDEVPAQQRLNPRILAERARFQAADGDAREAIATLEKLVGANPTVGEAWLQLGLLHERARNEGKAANAFIQARRHRPISPAYGAMIVRGLFRTGSEEDARAFLSTLKQQSGDEPNVIMASAWLAAKDGKYDEALNEYQRILEINPNEATTVALADVYAKQGSTGKSIEVLQRWINEHPADRNATLALAQMQLNSGNTEAAIGSLSRLLDHRPEDVVLINELAMLKRRSNPAAAVELARRAYRLAPRSPEVMDTLGVLLLEAGEIAESNRLLGEAVSLRPGVPEIRFHFAQALLADNARQRGIAELERLVSRHPDAPESKSAKKMLEELRVN